MLEFLNNTEYAQWVRESLGWPIALTIHAFGTATVVGGTAPRPVAVPAPEDLSR